MLLKQVYYIHIPSYPYILSDIQIIQDTMGTPWGNSYSEEQSLDQLQMFDDLPKSSNSSSANHDSRAHPDHLQTKRLDLVM